jgi:hypothetical protein
MGAQRLIAAAHCSRSFNASASIADGSGNQPHSSKSRCLRLGLSDTCSAFIPGWRTMRSIWPTILFSLWPKQLRGRPGSAGTFFSIACSRLRLNPRPIFWSGVFVFSGAFRQYAAADPLSWDQWCGLLAARSHIRASGAGRRSLDPSRPFTRRLVKDPFRLIHGTHPARSGIFPTRRIHNQSHAIRSAREYCQSHGLPSNAPCPV